MGESEAENKKNDCLRQSCAEAENGTQGQGGAHGKPIRLHTMEIEQGEVNGGNIWDKVRTRQISDKSFACCHL